MLQLVTIAWYFCSYVVPHYLRLLWEAFMTRTVNKATAIQFINGKCHTMKRKSRKTALSGYYTCV